MPDLDLLAILAATVAAFVTGAAYYAVFGGRLAAVSDAAADEQPTPWTLVVELGRCLVVAVVVAGLASRGEIDEWAGGLLLGFALWIGFPVVLLTGATIHENTRWQVALIHSGDWLLKLLAVAVIVSVWQ